MVQNQASPVGMRKMVSRSSLGPFTKAFKKGPLLQQPDLQFGIVQELHNTRDPHHPFELGSDEADLYSGIILQLPVDVL